MSETHRTRTIAAVLRTASAVAGALALAMPAAAAGEAAWGASECGCLAHRLEVAERGIWRFAPGGGRGGAFDPATGRDHRNYPPDPQVDYRSMRLELDFPDLVSGRFTGVQRLRVAPIGVPVRALRLDASGLSVQSVSVDGKPVEHAHDGDVLTVRFAVPLEVPAGGTARETEIEIRYAADRPVDGLTFSPPTPEIPGVAPARGPEVHTQGETETNHFWFPIHDFPNIQLATEIVVTVPRGLQASANGAPVAHEVRGDRETWHWKQEKRHVPYLVSLVIGDFDRVELPNPLSKVPMTVWAPRGRGEDAKATYARTDRMVAVFERVFGQKYPWARYDQLIVRNFGAGGMENTSVTSMHPGAVLDAVARAEDDLDGLISHELCHQWTGDLITCRSWEHIWLNEGWATYGTALWMEERDGADGYWDSVLGNARVAGNDLPTNPEAMCSPVYSNAGETFGRPANPYPKGASILHMLRRMLGDEVFFRGVRAYFARHANGLAETHDFRRSMEEASGLGLEWFFDQWCFRPGSPKVKATLAYDAESRVLTVKAEQQQQVDARTPALRISLPVWVRTAAGETVVPVDMREKSVTVTATLDGPPIAAWVDPWLEALKTIEVEQPAAWTLGALGQAPTIAARRQALGAAAKVGTPESLAALAGIVRDAKARHTIRRDAVDAVAGLGTPEAKALLVEFARAGFEDPRIREASVGALRSADAAEAIAICRAILEPAEGAPREASYGVRARAIDVLAAHKAKDALPAVRSQLAVPSHGDQVSQAAARFLAAFGDGTDVAGLQARAALGIPDRARPTAIGALADLAPRLDAEARKGVEAFLLRTLEDPEERPAMAAGEALATLRCADALPRLRAMAEHDRDPSRRRRAADWVKRAEGK